MPWIGFVFPGQGSQTMGMGKELIEAFPEARAIYEQADRMLGINLSRLMLEGPEEDLKRTDAAQPAILTASLAAWEVIKRFRPPAQNCMFAGHSLGEYSALAAAEALDFATAVRLVRLRGQSMQTAADQAGGGMAALLGPTPNEAEDLCAKIDQGASVQVANLNCPGQVVVSGTQAGLEKLALLAKEKKIKMIPLAVAGPFHSRWMQSAADRMLPEFNSAGIQVPQAPVLANVTAKPVFTPEEIRKALAAQITGAVRWEETIRNMLAAGVQILIEVGPGKVLRGLAKKISPEIRVLGAFLPGDFEEIKSALDAGQSTIQ